MINKYIWAPLLLLLLTDLLKAQEVFTLDKLIDRALEENYQIRIVRNQEEIADNNNTLGNAGFFPNVTFSGDRLYSIESSKSQYYTGVTRSGNNAGRTSLNAMVEVNWMIFDGLKMFAQRDRLDLLAQQSQMETRYYLEQTVSDIAKAYYNLIGQKQLLANYRQSLEISRFRLDLERKKLNVGSGNALLYNQALMDFNGDSIQVVEQSMVIRNLKISINEIINRELETDLQLGNDEIIRLNLDDKDSLIQSAIHSNIDLGIAQINELLSETNRRLEAGDRYPTFSIFGNYAYSRQTSDLGFVESSHSYGPQYGFSIGFKLYDGGKESLQLKNARLEEENAGIDKNRIKQSISASLLSRLNQHQAYLEELKLTSENVAAAEKSLQIAKQQLELGTIDGYDFRVTQQAVIQVRNRLTQLQYQLLDAEIDLLRMSGKLLPLMQ